MSNPPKLYNFLILFEKSTNGVIEWSGSVLIKNMDSAQRAMSLIETQLDACSFKVIHIERQDNEG